MDKSAVKIMTQSLRMLYSEEQVADYIRYIIKSDISEEYWREKINQENNFNKNINESGK